MAFTRMLKRNAIKLEHKKHNIKNKIAKKDRIPFFLIWFNVQDKLYGEKEHYKMCLDSCKKNDKFRMIVAERNSKRLKNK